MTIATQAQLLARLGQSAHKTADEEARAGSCLEAAAELMRDTAGDELASPTLRLQQICVDVALRAFTNPEAWGQRSLGDENKSYARGGVAGGDIVYLTATERRTVLKAVDKSSFKSVRLVTPYSGDDGSDTLL